MHVLKWAVSGLVFQIVAKVLRLDPILDFILQSIGDMFIEHLVMILDVLEIIGLLVVSTSLAYLIYITHSMPSLILLSENEYGELKEKGLTDDNTFYVTTKDKMKK